MARTFVRSESDYLEANSAPALSTAYSLGVWYNPSSVANGTAFSFGSSATGAYIAVGMNGSGNAFAEIGSGSGSDNVQAGALTLDEWNLIMLVQANANSRKVILNGVAGTPSVNNAPFSGLDRITVGGLVIGGDRLSFAGGGIGYANAWGTALSDGDVADLFAGAVPMSIGAPVAAYVITGTDSPELDGSGGGRNLTVSGAAAAPDGPPVDTGGGGLLVRVGGEWVSATRRVRVAGEWV